MMLPPCLDAGIQAKPQQRAPLGGEHVSKFQSRAFRSDRGEITETRRLRGVYQRLSKWMHSDIVASLQAMIRRTVSSFRRSSKLAFGTNFSTTLH